VFSFKSIHSGKARQRALFSQTVFLCLSSSAYRCCSTMHGLINDTAPVYQLIRELGGPSRRPLKIEQGEKRREVTLTVYHKPYCLKNLVFGEMLS